MGQHASLYKTARWKALRKNQLSAHPLCRYCQQLGKVIGATVVDHIEPHKGDPELFHDPDNLQSLCKGCHDRHKQRQEHRGVLAGGDEKGFPADPRHHWNR